MKTFKTISIALCLALCSAIIFGCKNGAQTKDQTPQEKAPEGQVDQAQVPEHYSVPAELQYAQEETYQAGDQTYPLYIIDKFYPIGWSKDGKLAYIEEPADEAVGAYFFQFHILDLNTGKDVFTWKPEEDPEEGSISQMCQDNKELFESKLKENGIIPQTFKLEGVEVPFIAENAKVWMDKTPTESNFLGCDVIKNVKVSCGTPKENKVIFEDENNEDYNTTLNQDIAGTLKFPYGDMAAVMVKSTQRGYEGPPHVYHFYFVKASK